MKKRMNVKKWLTEWETARAKKKEERKEFWLMFIKHPLGWFILMLLAYPFLA